MSEIEKVKSCPFCGGDAYETYMGNDIIGYKKSEIGCSKCHFKRIQRFIRYKFDFEWIKKVTREAWNKRSDT
jgi:hypothetical protein